MNVISSCVTLVLPHVNTQTPQDVHSLLGLKLEIVGKSGNSFQAIRGERVCSLELLDAWPLVLPPNDELAPLIVAWAGGRLWPDELQFASPPVATLSNGLAQPTRIGAPGPPDNLPDRHTLAAALADSAFAPCRAVSYFPPIDPLANGSGKRGASYARFYRRVNFAKFPQSPQSKNLDSVGMEIGWPRPISGNSAN